MNTSDNPQAAERTPMVSRDHYVPAFQTPFRVFYVLVCPKPVFTVGVPVCFEAGVLGRIAWFPKSVLQYLDPIGEYQRQIWQGRFLSHRLSIASDNYFANVAGDWYGDDALLTVFFLNTSREDCLLALEALHCPLLVTSDDKDVLRRLEDRPALRGKVFSTRAGFWHVFNLAIPDCLRRLRAAGLDTIASDIEGKLGQASVIRPPAEMRFTSFAPCRPNYYSMVQLTCPGRAEDVPVEKVTPRDRVVHLVRSVQDLMGLEHQLSQFEISGKSFAGFRPPLIFVAPYLGSGLANQIARSGTKGLSAAMQQMVRGFAAASRHEQNSTDYNVELPTQSPATQSPEGLIAALDLATKRVSFLDDIGYLHSSFQVLPGIAWDFSLNNRRV